ncbi:hypothetical protein [Roseibium sediminicola]|uniref:Uncharacterized protein n=1 Tax=Roseibium sediminicola TaxID=2933272 RepID=A0ABT0GSB4_9HYPH|nr:hypothetical protein [Roseibium sp. CAU 1639]MCK7612336.1 hypothetical protein [Roseibium sp. CAU 1639]
MLRTLLHGSLILLLTLLTQLGGLAWIIALPFKRRVPAFLIAYAALSVSAIWLAPAVSGRVALPCFSDGPLKVQSWLYCGLNRNYVSPEIKTILDDLSAATDSRYPRTQTLVLDANFPFFDGFPLLPHLSHDDGGKVDLAFHYQDASGYLRGATRSPIGYFAFEQGPTSCPSAALSLRWDFDFLQPFWPDLEIEPERTRFAVAWLAADPRTGKLFLEPHLTSKLGLASPKIRFQGCRAARHDDHIHFQL